MITIAIVNRHAIIRTGLCAAFRTVRPAVRVVDIPHCQDVLPLLATHQPDVLILEYCEHTTLQRRTIESWKETCPRMKVLVLSDYEHQRYRDAALHAGADAYLTTMDSFATLSRAVRELAAGRRVSAHAPGTRTGSGPLPAADALSRLSEREFETLVGLCKGQRLKEIAGDMGVGEKSAHEYRSRLCTKLEIKSPADLVRFAIDNGLIPCACQRTRSPARRAP